MYKLKTTSTSARFYSWIWKTDITNFKNMCPYFWTYVLTIIFLPLILVGKLIFYLMPAKKKIIKITNDIAYSKVGMLVGGIFAPNRFWDILGKIFKWAFFVFAGLLVLGIIIILFIEFFKNPIIGLAVMGGIAIIIVIIFLIAHLFDEHNLGSKIAYPFKLFRNMVYSLYKNICPLINWEKL